MKMKGKITMADGTETEALILVSTGTNQNFISERLVKELNIPETETPFNYRVVNAIGTTVRGKGAGKGKGNGICRGVVIKVQGLTVTEDFIAVDLGKKIDVILGTPWVRGLGRVEFSSIRTMVMKVVKGNETVTLKADDDADAVANADGVIELNTLFFIREEKENGGV